MPCSSSKEAPRGAKRAAAAAKAAAKAADKKQRTHPVRPRCGRRWSGARCRCCRSGRRGPRAPGWASSLSQAGGMPQTECESASALLLSARRPSPRLRPQIALLGGRLQRTKHVSSRMALRRVLFGASAALSGPARLAAAAAELGGPAAAAAPGPAGGFPRPAHGDVPGGTGGARGYNLVPMVIETSGRGERAYDIYSRLLRERTGPLA